MRKLRSAKTCLTALAAVIIGVFVFDSILSRANGITARKMLTKEWGWPIANTVIREYLPKPQENQNERKMMVTQSEHDNPGRGKNINLHLNRKVANIQALVDQADVHVHWKESEIQEKPDASEMHQTRSKPQTPVSSDEVRRRFQQRYQTLTQACRKYKNSTKFHPIGNTDNIILGPYTPVMNKSAKFCLIEKCASTTWKGIISSIRKKMRMLKIHQEKSSSNREDEVRFLFVREPYGRLLSAYVDKLFAPNTAYWFSIGRYIIKAFRRNPSETSLRCGHDVTFPEFIRYVISSQETKYYRDGHFIPTHDHCHMCHNSYDYVGHLETLTEDVNFLLDLMESPLNYTKNYNDETIRTGAVWVLRKMRPNIKKCISMKEALLRLWKKWHIRGIISKTEPMPLTAQQAEVISESQFVNLSLQAVARSGPERKNQKTEVLREAFGSVPMSERLALRETLFLDFELFGYDSNPEAVFSQISNETSQSTYRYFGVSIKKQGQIDSVLIL